MTVSLTSIATKTATILIPALLAYTGYKHTSLAGESRWNILGSGSTSGIASQTSQQGDGRVAEMAYPRDNKSNPSLRSLPGRFDTELESPWDTEAMLPLTVAWGLNPASDVPSSPELPPHQDCSQSDLVSMPSDGGSEAEEAEFVISPLSSPSLLPSDPHRYALPADDVSLSGYNELAEPDPPPVMGADIGSTPISPPKGDRGRPEEEITTVPLSGHASGGVISGVSNTGVHVFGGVREMGRDDSGVMSCSIRPYRLALPPDWEISEPDEADVQIIRHKEDRPFVFTNRLQGRTLVYDPQFSWKKGEITSLYAPQEGFMLHDGLPDWEHYTEMERLHGLIPKISADSQALFYGYMHLEDTATALKVYREGQMKQIEGYTERLKKEGYEGADHVEAKSGSESEGEMKDSDADSVSDDHDVSSLGVSEDEEEAQSGIETPRSSIADVSAETALLLDPRWWEKSSQMDL